MTALHSYASSYENSCSESSGGQGMGKIGENFGVEPDKSQKEERGDSYTVKMSYSYLCMWMT